jgi:predicted CXXCH cytochrome family protein
VLAGNGTSPTKNKDPGLRRSATIGLCGVLALAMTQPVARAAPIDEAGICAQCHSTQVGALIETGGHAAVLDCQSCHGDRRPGQVGEGHRAIPRCSSCHDTSGHPPRRRTRGRRAEIRNCSRCHDVHGSSNLSLVQTSIRTRGRLVPMRFDSTAGAAPGGFTNPDDPGTGLCEVCHKKTRFYPSSGDGEPHFTDTCTQCHDHAAGFEPVADDQNCALCHEAEAQRFTLPSAHSEQFACSGCHADAGAPPGPDHRAITPCTDCHDTSTHAPGGTGLPCAQCHQPHGTTNLSLVAETVQTVQGPFVPIRFENLNGQADGSFASLSAPGTGICEVCHTTTQFYRADGSGPAGHFTLSCLPCHRHSEGFAPQ